MKKQTAAAVIKGINERSEEARTNALFEIKSLKKDLLKLEKELGSKKNVIEDPAFDLTHSAFEIFRQTQVMAENAKLIKEIEKSLEKNSYKEYLDSKGARLLKKPEGWHWISPAGEMCYLADGPNIQEAAEKLESLISSKRKKAPAKKVATPQTKKEPKTEAKSKTAKPEK